MSVAKLLLSGLLVASGLILGAFTLHARFAPEWEVQATAARAHARPQPVDVTQEPDGIAAGDVPNNWAPRLVKTDPKPPAADAEATAKAKRKLAEKKQAEKRPKADKAKEEEQPPTVFSWLATLLNK